MDFTELSFGEVIADPPEVRVKPEHKAGFNDQPVPIREILEFVHPNKSIGQWLLDQQGRSAAGKTQRGLNMQVGTICNYHAVE